MYNKTHISSAMKYYYQSIQDGATVFFFFLGGPPPHILRFFEATPAILPVKYVKHL